jgi:aspartate carbamoyltransferase catalytic subunit
MKRDLVSIDDLSLQDIRGYLDLASELETLADDRRLGRLAGKLMMTMFFEPSTRTRLSFEAAMCRLGGRAIGFAGADATSVAKGESLADTVRTVENYADILVIRHPREGTARLAAEISRLPVVNAGDGANQHPSQTLLDLYTIQKIYGRIGDLRIAFVGDLKYSRTVHSLIRALIKFSNLRFTLVSPESLRLPAYLIPAADQCPDVTFQETGNLEEAIRSCDLLYMTRVQRERFPDPLEFERVKDTYCIDAAMLRGAPDHLRIMHPLPRVNEIAYSVDRTTYASYFQQVQNGLIMRQAILLTLLEVAP